MAATRFVAPARDAVDRDVFETPPLALWREYVDLLATPAWPTLGELNDRFAPSSVMAARYSFVEQTTGLLDDDLHYEQRIARRGEIATRVGNWHDLLNALIWIRHPRLKVALNRRQVADIESVGPRMRTRAQCALTHFDEGGIIVVLRDRGMLAAWDAHDWHALFWRDRAAWVDGRAQAHVFGHALLEHALHRDALLVGKALVLLVEPDADVDAAIAADTIAALVEHGTLLTDPQELRPLPLSGIPGWHRDGDDERFFRDAVCFRPLREGRRYPPPTPFAAVAAADSGTAAPHIAVD